MSKPTVLLVDDDEDLVARFSIQLKKEFTVVSELIGSNALKVAAIHKPKVVLLDLNMPNVDGYEVLMQFKNHPVTSNLPVICMSADHSEAARVRANNLGAIGFIKKPPEYKHVIQDIHRILSAINPVLESSDKKTQFTIAFNEEEKNSIMFNSIEEFMKENSKIIVISWRDGQDFFREREIKGIDEEVLIYLKIKPSLITKFPYMQELGSIANDIKNFMHHDSKDFIIVIDEPLLLFGNQDASNATAKIFSLTELFSTHFKKTVCYATRQRDAQKDAFQMGLAKAFVGIAA